MAEMYLYPEIEVMWAQAEQGHSPDQQLLQANMEAVVAAKKLLSDVHMTDKIALQHKVGQTCVAWHCSQSSFKQTSGLILVACTKSVQ